MSHQYNIVGTTIKSRDYIEKRRAFNGAMREAEREINGFHWCETSKVLEKTMTTMNDLLDGRGTRAQLKMVEFIFDINRIGERFTELKREVIIKIIR